MGNLHQIIDHLFPTFLNARKIKSFGYQENDPDRVHIINKHLLEIAHINYLALIKGRLKKPVNQNVYSIRNFLHNPSYGNLLEEYDQQDAHSIKVHLKEIAKLEFSGFIEGYLIQTDEDELKIFGTENMIGLNDMKEMIDLFGDKKLDRLFQESRNKRYLGSIKDFGFFDD